MLGAVGVALALGGAVQADEWGQPDYEWEPDEGLHEEEWYDPTDWFDSGPGVDYEDDTGLDDWVQDMFQDDGERNQRFQDDFQDSFDDDVESYYTEDYDRQRQARRGVTIEGKIDGFRHVDIKRTGERHTLVRIETEDGERKIIDLGPRADLVDLDLERGDRLRIRGRNVQRDGQRIVCADQLQTDEEVLRIRQQSRGERAGQDFDERRDERRQQLHQQLRQGRAQQRASEEGEIRLGRTSDGRVAIRGRVERTHVMRMRSGERHLFAAVSRPGAEAIVVDLGPTTEMERLGLRGGENVLIIGRPARSSGKLVIVADEVTRGDQRIRILEPEARDQGEISDR